MRQIGVINDESQAARLSAYLLTQGIDNRVDRHDGAYEVWVKDEDLLEQARREFDQFLADPDDPKYAAALQEARSILRERVRKQVEQQRRTVHVGPGPVRRRQPLTLSLIIISAIVGLATNFGAPEVLPRSDVFKALTFTALEGEEVSAVLNANDRNLDAWNVRLANINRGEIWRVITPIFIHFSVVHLLFNVIWLYQLGGRIENRYGTFWFGMLVLASAAISNMTQCLVPDGWGGAAPVNLNDQMLLSTVGGLSGVVYALFGFMWMKSIYDRSSGFYMPPLTVAILIGWLFFCMVPGTEQLVGGKVANWAHGVGLVVGMFAGYWTSMLPRRPRTS